MAYSNFSEVNIAGFADFGAGASNSIVQTNFESGVTTNSVTTSELVVNGDTNFQGGIINIICTNVVQCTPSFNLAAAANYTIGGTRVVTAQQANIAWVNSDAPNNNTRINAIISALEAHGLLAEL
jgi:hypothetical protein